MLRVACKVKGSWKHEYVGPLQETQSIHDSVNLQLTLQETRSIPDSMKLPKIAFIS